MKKQAAFTLIELMVVIAILGILGATAIQGLSTYRQRSHGAEAAIMLKQILDAEVMYVLEHNQFFPGPGQTIQVFKDDPPSKAEIQQIKDALNVAIPVKHRLDFTITHGIGAEGPFCIVTIDADFPIYKGGEWSIRAQVDDKGTIEPL